MVLPSVTESVDAPKIEKELMAMWAEMSAPEGEGQSAGVVRACVLNLVVFAANKEERAEADELLETVVERHPCRAIVIAAERDSSEARLDAYASTRCQISTRGAKRICGEQITIEAAGAAVETVSTAVAPLLVPDVPVFLWWKDIPHGEDKLFERFCRLSDRVVIDSSSFDHPHEDLLRLAEVLSKGDLRLSDLNWGRLTSWRSLVAGFWDVPEYRESLARVERVRIEYDPPDRSHEEVAPKALLALGWMASCLGWDVAGEGSLEGGGARFNLRDREGRDIEVVLAATDDVAGRDGWITSLTIETASGDEFYVVLHMSGRKLETGVRRAGGAGDAAGRVLTYEARSEGERLSAELEILSRDVLYESSAALAARMLASAR